MQLDVAVAARRERRHREVQRVHLAVQPWVAKEAGLLRPVAMKIKVASVATALEASSMSVSPSRPPSTVLQNGSEWTRVQILEHRQF